MPVVLGFNQGAALRLVAPAIGCRASLPWFRLDRLAGLAGRLNQLGGAMPVVLGFNQGAALRLVAPAIGCRASLPWFRLDRLAGLAGRLNQLGGG